MIRIGLREEVEAHALLVRRLSITGRVGGSRVVTSQRRLWNIVHQTTGIRFLAFAVPVAGGRTELDSFGKARSVVGSRVVTAERSLRDIVHDIGFFGAGVAGLVFTALGFGARLLAIGLAGRLGLGLATALLVRFGAAGTAAARALRFLCCERVRCRRLSIRSVAMPTLFLDFLRPGAEVVDRTNNLLSSLLDLGLGLLLDLVDRNAGLFRSALDLALRLSGGRLGLLDHPGI